MTAEVYDDGGWLRPGYTLAYNSSGKPERVWRAEDLEPPSDDPPEPDGEQT